MSGAKDTAGNTMAPMSWTFSTAARRCCPPRGSGGPIGVVTSGADPFSSYFAEILRAEGLNSFATFDVGNLSANTLGLYDTVVVGRVALTPAQATILTTWVNEGGNLIAMRPDPELAGLLGLTRRGRHAVGRLPARRQRVRRPASGSSPRRCSSTAPPTGTPSAGASAVATLYSTATVADGEPCRDHLRTVGTNGGQAAAFTYDLARSVVYTRQGNPAWAGQERDGRSRRSGPTTCSSAAARRTGLGRPRQGGHPAGRRAAAARSPTSSS